MLRTVPVTGETLINKRLKPLFSWVFPSGAVFQWSKCVNTGPGDRRGAWDAKDLILQGVAVNLFIGRTDLGLQEFRKFLQAFPTNSWETAQIIGRGGTHYSLLETSKVLSHNTRPSSPGSLLSGRLLSRSRQNLFLLYPDIDIPKVSISGWWRSDLTPRPTGANSRIQMIFVWFCYSNQKEKLMKDLKSLVYHPLLTEYAKVLFCSNLSSLGTGVLEVEHWASYMADKFPTTQLQPKTSCVSLLSTLLPSSQSLSSPAQQEAIIN